MTCVRSFNHIGVVVDDLDAAVEFFVDLGLEHEGSMSTKGECVENVTGLDDVHSDVAFVRTPDSSGTFELIKFHSPADDHGVDAAPANRVGLRHVAFVVEDLHGMVEKLRGKGYGLVGKVDDYEETFRLCYVRGPGGIIVELAEQLG
ncbi:MAG TPA: VOC family protein [Pseudonocardiaceae bacterium]|nr:VOC family protein [Pseudonocardiaceae bacterium]